ncbi:MAG: phenylalanine--tRNA ligase subunit beta [Chitinophagia bacterium]|jgi:phenylalanyl-tRNA synthetase beta chain
MTISYKWLMDYFAEPIAHDKLANILNAIGLEVESYDEYQEIKGGLAGLVTGEVLTVEKHPNADRLSVTTVNIGGEAPLQIVCGAPNVAAGQKVIVAPIGTTIFPVSGEPVTMKAAKIRGVESQGMICADDEVGLGTDHSGIRILEGTTAVGIPVASLFEPYDDNVISIGLTPNRSDAMSHWGVARDVCTWLNHHEGKSLVPVSKEKKEFIAAGNSCPIEVIIENTHDCPRYTGMLIENVSISAAPKWMQQRLKAIGQRPINNIVDITNYILHDTGQPLHAFDADMIKGKTIRVKNLASGTLFLGLDEKERKLNEGDLMICDGDSHPMCIGGVFGGSGSGVTEATKNIFLESAWFHPVSIRKSSFRHQLRTDAAMHFEKSVDIGQTLNVLKKAVGLICDHAGGKVQHDLVDVYPVQRIQPLIKLEYGYVRKMSGKEYSPETIRKILLGMGFELKEESANHIVVETPTHKTDVSIPADLVEEIMRIDGFDNIEIPSKITISPSVSSGNEDYPLREKLSGILTGMGFNEMLNNSITHSAYYDDEEIKRAVKMLNNLSSELDTLRLTMLETGLQTVAHNLNHRNDDLLLFEFGKTYSKTEGKYVEEDHLALFTAGLAANGSWNKKEETADLYFLKGAIEKLAFQSGISGITFQQSTHHRYEYILEGSWKKHVLVTIGKPADEVLKKYDIRTSVWHADINWMVWLEAAGKRSIRYREISKFPMVQRDLSFVAAKSLTYHEIEKELKSLSIPQLKNYRLFDIFKSDKLGKDKQSMAMNFVFQDEQKTMKDEEVDAMMNRITAVFESKLQAEIRK